MNAPAGLGKDGKRLWKAILGDLPANWELDEREFQLLALAARQADDLAKLETAIKAEGVITIGSTGQPVVHPAVLEARQARLAISRLVGLLELPDADEQPTTAATTRSRKAAQARWNRRERLDGMRGGAANG
jgi:phage terminase small subunit